LSLALAESNPAAQRKARSEAAAFYQAALLTDATNGRAANELGVMLARDGELLRARDLLAHSVQMSPNPSTHRNLAAAHSNPWFDPAFVTILDGTADALPVADGSAGVVAQNCLFNVFVDRDLQQALAEVHRVLAVGGRFSTSDPITTEPLPRALTENRTLRARCIAGCISYERYLKALHGAGFQQLVVRARRPYRLLLPSEFAELSQPILLESLEVLALKTEAHKSEPDVYCGRHAIYLGSGSYEHAGLFTFHRGVPVPVADGLASALSQRADFTVTAPTFAARGVGCC
jgi:SAM-dependent methyltransferase